MSVAEILHQIEALSTEERIQLLEKLFELPEANIPESLRQSMAEAERGELIDMDDALQELHLATIDGRTTCWSPARQDLI